MKRRNRFWWIVGAVAIVAVAGYFWLAGKDADKVSYRFDKIDRGDIVVAISATGTLNAVTTVEVGSQVSGTIAKLYVDFNSVVKEGQLLAQLDPTFLQASVAQERANVGGARAQVNQSDRNFKRTKELFDKGMVSQADLDVATTEVESAAARLLQAEASCDRAEVNLKYATIRAPISGVVISRDVDVGQTVAASLQAPKLFSIANDLSKMQVTASVDEADIGQVSTGQSVSFRVDAFPEVDFYGTVSQIRLAPVISQNVVTYNVIIEVDNPEQKLMPGMTATCSIEVAKRENVLRVPLAALRFTPANGTPEKMSPAASTGGPQAAPERPSMDSVHRQMGDRFSGEGRPHRQWGDSSRMRRPRGDSSRMRRQWGDSARQFGDHANQRPSEQSAMPKALVSRGRIWVMENGQLKPVTVVRGIQNQRYAELIECPINEGDSIIIGTNGVSATTSAPQGQNPFMPRMPGGPGGGQRGGR
ncbi:MAG: efflux RND transporter periplasmic adaptor subunit [candidate division Zixibacteria bacterium]|nr:efflux RND transporter periplasmic adaptor subunit [candidate division Zixibacteria bacterium]